MYFLMQAQRETWPQNPLEQKDCKHVSRIITSSPWLVLALNPWDDPAMLCLAACSVPSAFAVWGAPSSSSQVGLFTGISLQPFPWLWCLHSGAAPLPGVTTLGAAPQRSLWRAGTALPGPEPALTPSSAGFVHLWGRGARGDCECWSCCSQPRQCCPAGNWSWQAMHL